jgi:hypothetical protein
MIKTSLLSRFSNAFSNLGAKGKGVIEGNGGPAFADIGALKIVDNKDEQTYSNNTQQQSSFSIKKETSGTTESFEEHLLQFAESTEGTDNVDTFDDDELAEDAAPSAEAETQQTQGSASGGEEEALGDEEGDGNGAPTSVVEVCKVTDSDTTKEAEQEQVDNEKEINRMERIFGVDCVSKMNNKKWSIRRTAVESVRIMVEGSASRMAASAATTVRSKEQEFFQMACVFSKRMMKDTVTPVFYSVLELLDSLLSRHTDYVTVEEPITEALKSLVPPLLKRMCETNKRTQREAATLLLKLSSNDKLNGLNIVSSFLLVPGPNAIRPRLNLLRLLLPSVSVHLKNNSPLTLGSILGVAVPALGIAEDKTRRAAISLTVECYGIARKRVNRHLRGVKPAMLRILHTRFSEIDEETCPKSASSSAEEEFLGVCKSRPHSVTGLPSAGKLPPLRTSACRRVSSAGPSRIGDCGSPLLTPTSLPSPLSAAVTPTSGASDLLCRSTYDSGDGLLGFGTRSVDKYKLNSIIASNQEPTTPYGNIKAGQCLGISDESFMDSILANEF